MVPNVATIIIISGNKHAIDGFKNDIIGNNDNSKWKFVVNGFDQMTDSGYIKSFDKDIINEYGMESILCTIYVQQNAKFYIVQMRSNWDGNMLTLSYYHNLFKENRNVTKYLVSAKRTNDSSLWYLTGLWQCILKEFIITSLY